MKHVTLDDVRFTVGDRYVGHGMPGVDLVWHRQDEPCAVCDEMAANPTKPKHRVSKVDSTRGVVTIESIEEDS
jgi:hypothetical protein